MGEEGWSPWTHACSTEEGPVKHGRQDLNKVAHGRQTSLSIEFKENGSVRENNRKGEESGETNFAF